MTFPLPPKANNNPSCSSPSLAKKLSSKPPLYVTPLNTWVRRVERKLKTWKEEEGRGLTGTVEGEKKLRGRRGKPPKPSLGLV